MAALLYVGCREVAQESYAVPDQIPPIANVDAGSVELQSRIVLDDISSFLQVRSGFHQQHPSWLDGRWMGEQAEVQLRLDPRQHTKLVVRGLCEQYQLDMVGPMTLTVNAGETELLSGVVSKDGTFQFEAKLPTHWKPSDENVTLQLNASPSWTQDGWNERYTLTIIEIAFEAEH